MIMLPEEDVYKVKKKKKSELPEGSRRIYGRKSR